MPDWATNTEERAGHFETQTLSIGPSHPATHGIVHMIARLDGEKITRAETQIGYLHRCFEKMAETHTWNQVIPFCDRLNYVSAMLNGVGYALTVEKMLGIEVPDRGRLVRTILSEFSRIMDHCVCIGTNLADIGGRHEFLGPLPAPREDIYGLLEACCGARLTVSYVRLGGLAIDVPDDFVPRRKALLESIPKFLDDVDRLVTRNRSPATGSPGTGAVTRNQAIAWGLTGPMLRATGVDYDVRRAGPYQFYYWFDLDVAIAGRRQLRPVPGANGGDAAVAEDHPAGARRVSRVRSGQLRRLARRAAAEGRRVPRHGVPHLPLQAHHGRNPGPAR